MGTFVTSTPSIPPDKSDLYPPTGASTELDAVDFNFIKNAAGDLRDHVTGWVNPKSSAYGAKMDGATDDTAALVAAHTDAVAKGYGLFIPGKIRLAAASTTTLTVPIRFGGGGSFDIRSGATLVINGSILAHLTQIFFMNSGTLTIGIGANHIGYPEWFGAVTGGPDCLAALRASYKAFPVTQCQGADYYISSTFKMSDTGWRTVRGTSKHRSSSGQGTAFIVTSHTVDGVQLGPDTQPGGGINNFLQEQRLENITVSRSLNTTGLASLQTSPAGVRCQFVLYCYLDHVNATEHSNGFLFSGAVNVHATHCFASRSQSGTDAAHDPFFGYFYDGSASIGAAGGNASVFLDDCNASVGGSPALTLSAGFYGFQGYADTFITRMETSGLQYGAYLNGSSAPSSGTQDCHLLGCIFDQCSYAGVIVANGGANTNVELTNVYAAAVNAVTFLGGFVVSNQSGVTSILGGKVLGVNYTSAQGVYITNSSGVDVIGTQLVDCGTPVTLSNGTNCLIQPRIINPTISATLGAVYATGTNARNVIRPMVQGAANKFTYGINLASTANTSTDVFCSGIDPASVNGGSANKLLINAIQITATGLYTGAGASTGGAAGHNSVAGIMN